MHISHVGGRRQRQIKLNLPEHAVFGISSWARGGGDADSSRPRAIQGPFLNTDRHFDRPYLEKSVLEMSETSFSWHSCPNAPWISGIAINSVIVFKLLPI